MDGAPIIRDVTTKRVGHLLALPEVIWLDDAKRLKRLTGHPRSWFLSVARRDALPIYEHATGADFIFRSEWKQVL